MSISVSSIASLFATLVERRVADDDETFNAVVDKNVVDKNAVDAHPEEVFCRKVGDALSAGADFVDATFEPVEVSSVWQKLDGIRTLYPRLLKLKNTGKL